MEQKQEITLKKLQGLFKRNRLNTIVSQAGDNKFSICHLLGGATRANWIVEGHTATCTDTDNKMSVDVSYIFMHLIIAMNRVLKARQVDVGPELLADEGFMRYMSGENSGLAFSYIDVLYALSCLNYPAVTDYQAREIANRLNEQL